MIGKAHFYKLNYDFSPEFAQAHHNGEESENNRKFDWEDELQIHGDIDRVEIEKEGMFSLEGEGNDGAFSFEIPHMTLFHFIDQKGEKTTLACSTSLVNDFEVISEKDCILKVYIDEQEPLTNPMPGVYIHIENFPKELMGND